MASIHRVLVNWHLLNYAINLVCAALLAADDVAELDAARGVLGMKQLRYSAGDLLGEGRDTTQAGEKSVRCTRT